jgi:hypothetical protein
MHGHLDVHEDGVVLAGPGERSTASAPLAATSTTSRTLEELAGDLPVDLVVLDEQDPRRARSGALPPVVSGRLSAIPARHRLAAERLDDRVEERRPARRAW